MVAVSIWPTLFNSRRLASGLWAKDGLILVQQVMKPPSSSPVCRSNLSCLRTNQLKASPYLPAPAVYLAANWNPCRQKVAQLAHQRVTWGSRMIPQTSCLSRVFTSVNIHAQWLARTPSDCVHSYGWKKVCNEVMLFCWCSCLTCCFKKFSKVTNMTWKMLNVVCVLYRPYPIPFPF